MHAMKDQMTPSEYLRRTFENEGLVLDDAQVAAFLRYDELLREKNAVMNLTAITEFKEVVHKHFLDSCAPARLEKGAVL